MGGMVKDMYLSLHKWYAGETPALPAQTASNKLCRLCLSFQGYFPIGVRELEGRDR